MEDNKYISYRRQKYIPGKECLYWTTNIQRATCLRKKEARRLGKIRQKDVHKIMIAMIMIAFMYYLCSYLFIG